MTKTRSTHFLNSDPKNRQILCRSRKAVHTSITDKPDEVTCVLCQKLIKESERRGNKARDQNKRDIKLRIDPDLSERIKYLARTSGRTQIDIVETALRQYFGAANSPREIRYDPPKEVSLGIFGLANHWGKTVNEVVEAGLLEYLTHFNIFSGKRIN